MMKTTATNTTAATASTKRVTLRHGVAAAAAVLALGTLSSPAFAATSAKVPAKVAAKVTAKASAKTKAAKHRTTKKTAAAKKMATTTTKKP